MDKEEFMQEGMDMKRLFLRFLNKSWIVMLAAVIGAFLGSGLYLFIHVTKEKQLDYTAESQYYLDFATNENGNLYDYYNGYTWNEIMSTDPILGYTMTLLPDTMKREEVEKAITATIPSDVRILIITVVTKEKEDAQLIATKTTESLIHFAKEKKEFENISLIKYTKPQQIKGKLQIVRAAIAGILATVCLCKIIMIVFYILDDSVYTVEELDKRFHFKTLGIITKKKDKKTEQEVLLNLDYICKNEGKTAIVFIDRHMVSYKETNLIHRLTSMMEEDDQKLCKYHFLEFELSKMTKHDYEKLRDCKNLILAVAWGRGNRTLIQHSISQLEKQDCKITCAIIYNGSNRFIRNYYGSRI